MTYDQALKAMPNFLIASYDPLSHRTIGDLAFMVQHEIDLHEEGEESEIRTLAQYRAAQRYLAKLEDQR
jgi:hypothetical protein